MALFKPLFSHLTIRQKLTLLIFSFILFTLVLFSVISFLAISRTSLNAGKQRIDIVAEQLAAMLSRSLNRMKNEAENRADTPLITGYLQQPSADTGNLIEYLNNIANDSNTLQLALYDSAFHIKTVIADDALFIPDDISPFLLAIKNNPGNARVGNLSALGDTIVYPVIAPVMKGRVLLGFWVRWRTLKTSPDALEQLKNLMGMEARIFIGNQDGSLWTDMNRPVLNPPFLSILNEPDRVTDKRGDSTTMITASLPLQDSWQLVVLQSRSEILVPVKQHLKWMAIAGACILLLAFVASWLFSKRISKPILSLASSSTQLADGQYTGPDDIIDRFDELGKLGRAFNAMAWQIGNTRTALQKKAQDYKLLFHSNPMPMWISSLSTLKILDVNDAVINHYGYSREEFLQLDIRDIRPAEDVEKYMAHIKTHPFNKTSRGLWRHKKKDGSVIMVDIIANNITYDDQPARLIMINDVTEKLNVEAELIRNREMQHSLITKNTLEVQEREREEIGKELHDNINQILASAKLYLELATHAGTDLRNEAVSKSLGNINLAITEIRHLSKQLVAPHLHTSLISVLSGLTNEIRTITPLNINLQTSQFEEQHINDEFKLNIYRIVQEQVNNILKHAAASHMDIILETTDDEFHLVINDDGVGFDTSVKQKGIGLRNIDTRVSYYNGIVNIFSSPGKGTKLDILIPLIYDTP